MTEAMRPVALPAACSIAAATLWSDARSTSIVSMPPAGSFGALTSRPTTW